MARPKRSSLYRVGKIWHISYWQDGQRIRETTGTDNRKVAEETRRQRERGMILGTVSAERKISDALCDPSRREALLAAIDPGSLVTVQKALEEYEAHSASFKRPKTIANDRGRLTAFFAGVPVPYINDVTTKAINEFIAARVAKGKTSPTTILRFREILHALFEFLRKQGYVKTNPVEGVPRPRIPDRDIRFLTLDKIAGVLESVKGDRIEPLVATAIYAGLRREELCWLTWEDVDLTEARPLIRVRAKTVDDESWMPKTKKNRTVPISRDLLSYLARQSLGRQETPWVFTTPEGCRWNPDNLGHRLSNLMDEAGLLWNFLDFRHTFGSQLAQKGVSLYKISELMGNSPEIARRHYACLLPEEMHREVEFREHTTPRSNGRIPV